MLTRWLTFITLLGCADSVTVAPTCRVKGELLVQLMLRCGDGHHAGEVQFWHTPFGDLHTPEPPSDLAPVFLHHNRSLVIPSCSAHHGGLYYCIQHHPQGSTLWPYELHVAHHNQNQNRRRSQEVTSRFRRSFRLGEEVVSDGLFAGAVTASVLLTFTVGFSAGALARTHVLRCLRGVTMRLRLPRKRHNQTDMPDHSSQVTIATLPPVYASQVFEAEVMNRDSPTCGIPEKDVSMTTPSPPAKPKRSFRQKRQEEQPTAYLEGCDHRQEEEAEKDVKEGEEKEMKSEADDHGREKDGGERSEERPEAAGEQEGRDDSDEEHTPEEDQKTEPRGGLEQKSTETEEKSSKNEEKTSSCASRRSSRVIRLYQYDEDGQRFSHLPEPGCEDPEPDHRLRLRSLSLTRLNAIMMAASTGPMEARESGEEQEQGEGPQHFQMEI